MNLPTHRVIKSVLFNTGESLTLTFQRDCDVRPLVHVSELSEIVKSGVRSGAFSTPLSERDLLILLLEINGWVLSRDLIKTPAWLTDFPIATTPEFAPAYLTQLAYSRESMKRRCRVEPISQNGFYCTMMEDLDERL